MAGRIAAIADVLDSLACACSYREAWPFDKAFNHVVSESGLHFDPALISILVAQRGAIEAIYA